MNNHHNNKNKEGFVSMKLSSREAHQLNKLVEIRKRKEKNKSVIYNKRNISPMRKTFQNHSFKNIHSLIARQNQNQNQNQNNHN